MAVGDPVIAKDVDFDEGDELDLAPSSGTVIWQQIAHTGPIDVYAYDGVNKVKLDDLSQTASGLMTRDMRATATERYLIKAPAGAGANQYVRAIGVQVA